jgi:DNA modification methylase/SAM-dependent methyltransferase
MGVPPATPADPSAAVNVGPEGRRRGTATSAFGVGRREGHDASGFYSRFTPPKLSVDDTVALPTALDSVWVGDARSMDSHGSVADRSVALVVTSPPYFAGKEYEQEMGVGHVPADFADYLNMLHDVFAQCFAKLEPGGRIADNVANLGRKPYRSLAADVIDLLEGLGFLLRGEIIWQKSHAAGGSCAWGTYQRPGNPVLRDVSERIVVASKERFDRAVPADERAKVGLPHEGTITMDEFIDATTDVWEMPAESATRVGHPAPFPIELPRRLIELYTYRGDLVLDPFMGSGSTAVAAVRTERHFVGFDTDAAYVALAERRVAEERESGTPGRLRVTVPASRSVARPAVGTPEERAIAAGAKARDLALLTLAECGFINVEERPKFTDLGVAVDYRARDAEGRTWLFLLTGAYSASRPGLKRADVLWRSLGVASVLHIAQAADPVRDDIGPLVLLTTDVPPPRSAGGRALRSVWGDGLPILDVCLLLDPQDAARLAAVGSGRPPSPQATPTSIDNRASITDSDGVRLPERPPGETEWDGEAYQQRFDELAASGSPVHGEADFVERFDPSSVLDAGCGTGRVTAELSERGYDVVGIDRDVSMITTARALAPDVDFRIEDASRARLGRVFALVLMAGNVPLFTPEGSHDALVSGCARHLSAGGRLVAGFQLDRGYSLAEYDAACASVGLVLETRFSTWGGEPYGPDDDYAVSVHRLTAGVPIS